MLEGARAAGREAQEVEGFGFKGLAQAVLVGSVPSKLEAADAFTPNFKNYFQYQVASLCNRNFLMIFLVLRRDRGGAGVGHDAAVLGGGHVGGAQEPCRHRSRGLGRRKAARGQE